MINGKHLAMLLGFGFAAVWAALGFGAAVGCLVAALVFWLVAVVAERELDPIDLDLQRLRRGMRR